MFTIHIKLVNYLTLDRFVNCLTTSVKDLGCKCIMYVDASDSILLLVSNQQYRDVIIESVETFDFCFLDDRVVDIDTFTYYTMMPDGDNLQPISYWLGTDSKEDLWIEDLSIGELIGKLEIVDRENTKVNLLESCYELTPKQNAVPFVSLSINFVSNALERNLDVDKIQRLMQMVKYQCSLIGEDVYPNVIPLYNSTMLELESQMQDISEEMHFEFVGNISTCMVDKLMECYDGKSKVSSEIDIVGILYEHYVYKYVSVSENRGPLTLWIFEDGLWKETSSAVIWKDLVVTFVSFLNSREGLFEITKYIGSVNNREKIQKDLIQRLFDKDFVHKLNSNIHLIGMNNGVYDTNMGILRKSLAGDYVSMSTNNNYNLNDRKTYRKREILMDILSTIFPEEEVLTYFIRSCAMLLEGRNKNKLVYIWWGKGNNGKSMIEKLLSKALGDYSTIAPTSLITSKRSSSDTATPQLSCLEGKLVVFLQEPNPNEVIHIGTVKELTGGDTITGRALYKAPKTFVPKFKLILVCNNFMDIPNADIAFKNRLVVIPFLSTFYPRENYESLGKKKTNRDFLMDTNVYKNIEEYGETFLGILLEEYNRIKDSDIVMDIPTSIKDCTKEYISWNNSVLNFFNNSGCIVDELAEIPLSYLYQEYKLWVSDNLTKKPVDRLSFRQEVESQGHTITGNIIKGVMYQKEM